MVADKSLLVEHCPVPAEEAVLGRAGHQPVVVLDRQADVEDLSWRIKFVGGFAICSSPTSHPLATSA